MPCNNSGENGISFEAFFTGWLLRQKNYLDQLISAQKNFQNISELELRSLVSQTLLHYQQHYAAKIAAARTDVFAMFAPRGSAPFQILDKSVDQDEFTDGQLEALYRLRMARVQEGVALPPLVNLASKNPAERRVDGETVDAAMQTLTEGDGNF
ncbi:hypothetical protein MKW92_032914, partial [Papaver armeniacum]